MKYIVTLKRKQTTNAVQNARQIRVEVNAPSDVEAKAIAKLTGLAPEGDKS